MSDYLPLEHCAKINEEQENQSAILREMSVKFLNMTLNNLHKDEEVEEGRKKQILTEWLNLESQLKLLQWRIRCTSLAAYQMYNQKSLYGADYKQALMGKIAELWQQQNKHNEEYNKFTEEMEEAKVTKPLQTDAMLKELQGEVAGLQMQQAHLLKIIHMQEKCIEDFQSVNDSVSKICSDYHMILRGRNLITDTMDKEYREVLLMKGLKAVTLMDMVDGSGVTLSSVIMRSFTKLSLAILRSGSLPSVFPGVLEKSVSLPVLPQNLETTTEPDLNGAFGLESTSSSMASSVAKTSKFVLPKVPSRSRASVVPMRKFTPASTKVEKVENKENNGTKRELLCQTSVRPKTAMASRQVNVQEVKTPNVGISETKAQRPKTKNSNVVKP